MTDETPQEQFDRWLAEVENTRKFQARQKRIARTNARRPLNPWTIAPVGLGLVSLGLLALGIVMAFGEHPPPR